MSFAKTKFAIIKKAIPEEIAQFSYEYLLCKRQVARTLFDTDFIAPFCSYFGVWNDAQVPDTYSHYSDILMETLLMKVKPVMERAVGEELIPNYSYTRIYKRGDVLTRHKDRYSCEISCTMFLGGDQWPIFLMTEDNKEIKVDLDQGDMLVYYGTDLEHWRDEFDGDNCAQVFLHYNKASNGTENQYDSRPHLGLPAEFKQNG